MQISRACPAQPAVGAGLRLALQLVVNHFVE